MFPRRSITTNAIRLFRGRLRASVYVLLMLLAFISHADAGEVKIPLTIDYVTLDAGLARQVYTGANERAELWQGADECQFLNAEHPRFSGADDKLRLNTDANLSLGLRVGERCVNPIEWSGIAESDATAYIDSNLALRLRVTDLNLYNREHQKTLLVGRGFDLIKQQLIPRLDTFSYDLRPGVHELAELAASASPPVAAERVRRAVDTLRADPQVTPVEDGLRVTLIISVPEFPSPSATPTPGALTPAELAAFDKVLRQWDAFLVFAVKQVGAAVGDQKFREQLLAILLDSRFRLVAALAHPARDADSDPVRLLFLDNWKQLRDAIRAAARRGQLGSRALEFLSFISAGDALFALDEAAPALGMRISADDLRRLARIMAPKATGDPLDYNFEVDPELRDIFKVPEPAASEAAAEGTTGDGVESAPPPSPIPGATPSSAPSPVSLLDRILDAVAPCEVYAATLTPATTPSDARAKTLAQKLRLVIVNQDNVEDYEASVRQLLEFSARNVLDAQPRNAPPDAMFVVLVKSTAWQESCWRQFVRVGDTVHWLESSTGDIGIMQVNKYVWRGLYKLDSLKWDMLYNTGAGAEILMRMLRYAIEKRGGSVRDLDGLARSAYAAYNGGPDAHDRWRGFKPGRSRNVDTAFWKKYRALRDGQSLDLLACAAQWSTNVND